jgi:hypothetical protein
MAWERKRDRPSCVDERKRSVEQELRLLGGVERSERAVDRRGEVVVHEVRAVAV